MAHSVSSIVLYLDHNYINCNNLLQLLLVGHQSEQGRLSPQLDMEQFSPNPVLTSLPSLPLKAGVLPRKILKLYIAVGEF